MTECPPTNPAVPGSPEHKALLDANQQLVLALLRDQGRGLLPGATPADDRLLDRDPLTGLPGRATLLQQFGAASAVAQHHGKRLGVLLLDLDGFKPVNDGSSDRIAGAALRHAARCLIAAVRNSDIVARIGDDRFVILLADLVLPSDAARVAEKMLRSLAAPEMIEDRAVSLSASIGISICPDNGSELESLIHQADGAMCRGKRQGAGYFASGDAEQPTRGRSPAADAPGVSHPQPTSIVGEQLQARMQEANERLLFAALTAQELRAAAERALGDQTALMARVAHELRNPLAPISMAASMIDRADVQELPRLRAMIERQVAHVSRLVGDLLDVSRAQVGKLRLQQSVLDIRHVASEVLEAFRPTIEARHQQLQVEMPVQPLLVDGDRTRLAQVLSNLIDNASKYTPEEGTITLAVHGIGTDVVISVTDTGIGMSAASISGVFQAFVQDPNATRFNGVGLGIGLTVVRDLVEAHHGNVQAFSAGEGHGSQFVVILPRHPQAGSRDEPAAQQQ